jgi:hypothetical protein
VHDVERFDFRLDASRRVFDVAAIRSYSTIANSSPP